jgi:hypothetical protein
MMVENYADYPSDLIFEPKSPLFEFFHQLFKVKSRCGHHKVDAIARLSFEKVPCNPMV